MRWAGRDSVAWTFVPATAVIAFLLGSYVTRQGAILIDWTAAANIAVGGVIAVVGGLLAAAVQADAAASAARASIEGQRAIARDAERRARRRAEVEPLVSYVSRLVKNLSRLRVAAQQAETLLIVKVYQEIIAHHEQLDEFAPFASGEQDLVSLATYVSTEDEEVRADLLGCLRRQVSERPTAILEVLDRHAVRTTALLLNAGRLANRYVDNA